ncbi:MAG: hypothetical protein ACKVX7_12885 [Planctomycetota bacterium]
MAVKVRIVFPALGALSLALSACSAPPPKFRGTLRSADEKFVGQDYGAALENYLAALDQVAAEQEKTRERARAEVLVAEIRVGRCHQQLGAARKAVDVLQSLEARVEQSGLDAALRSEYYFSFAQALSDHARNSEPVFLGDGVAQRARRTELGTGPAKHYEQARNLYRKVTQVAGSAPSPLLYDSVYGLGFCYLRLGILHGNNAQELQSAAEQFDRCQQLARDPATLGGADAELRAQHLNFGRGRLTLALANDKLSATGLEAVYKQLSALHAGQKKRNFDLHIAYRDMLDTVNSYDNPGKVEAISTADPDHGRIRQTLCSQMIEWLREYYRLAPSPGQEWKEFRARLKDYFASHDKWTQDQQFAKSSLDAARRLHAEIGVSVERFRRVQTDLEKVNEELKQAAEYRQVRSLLQPRFVRALIEQSRVLMLVGNYEAAERAVVDAGRLCEPLYVESHDSLHMDCDKQLDRIKGSRALAELRKNIENVMALDDGAQQATQLLADAKREKTVLLGDEFRSQFLQLESDVTKKGGAMADAHRCQIDYANAKNASQRLEIAKLFDKIVSDNQIDSLEVDAKRLLARTFYENDLKQNCLDAIEAIATPNQTDQMMKGIVLHERNDHEKAAPILNKIDPSVFSSSGAENERKGLLAMAVSNLRLPQPDPDHSYQAYATLVERHPEVKNDQTIVRGLIQCCSLKLARPDADFGQRKVWRENWRRWEPDNKENQRELIRLNYAEGQRLLKSETKTAALPVFEAAYLDLVTYLKSAALASLPAPDQDMAGRLVACFGDYAPLAVNRSWHYTLEDGSSEEQRVLEGSLQRFTVSIKFGGETDIQEWTKLTEDRTLLRGARGGGERIRPLLIGVPNPEEDLPYKKEEAGQVIAVMEVGVEFQSGVGKHENCIKVRVSRQGAPEYREYTLAPGIGIVHEHDSATGRKKRLASIYPAL